MERRLKLRVNGALRGTPHVRVIAADGQMLGVMELSDALRTAMAAGLDLVEVNPVADPPVCRILDLGKYKSEEQTKIMEAKRPESDDDSHDD
jgi:translation initiation factor IF-3